MLTQLSSGVGEAMLRKNRAAMALLTQGDDGIAPSPAKSGTPHAAIAVKTAPARPCSSAQYLRRAAGQVQRRHNEGIFAAAVG